MADSTVIDYSKMKVIELRKELKARGLSSVGDKSDLVARLQAEAVEAAETHEEADYALDSDEIDLDDDDEDKTAGDTSLDDSHVNDTLLADIDPVEKPKAESKPKTLKRKLVGAPDAEKQQSKAENGEAKESTAKKIVLHRPASIPAIEIKVDKAATPVVAENIPKPTPVEVKAATVSVDSKDKLQSRAKRFGLPMTDDEKKEARKIRFGQPASSAGLTGASVPKVSALDSNVEKLKKRAERFGQSVSKVMTDIEAKDRLEKRRAKFGLV